MHFYFALVIKATSLLGVAFLLLFTHFGRVPALRFGSGYSLQVLIR